MQVGGGDHEQRRAVDPALVEPAPDLAQRENERGSTSWTATAIAGLPSSHSLLRSASSLSNARAQLRRSPSLAARDTVGGRGAGAPDRAPQVGRVARPEGLGKLADQRRRRRGRRRPPRARRWPRPRARPARTSRTAPGAPRSSRSRRSRRARRGLHEAAERHSVAHAAAPGGGEERVVRRAGAATRRSSQAPAAAASSSSNTPFTRASRPTYSTWSPRVTPGRGGNPGRSRSAAAATPSGRCRRSGSMTDMTASTRR